MAGSPVHASPVPAGNEGRSTIKRLHHAGRHRQVRQIASRAPSGHVVTGIVRVGWPSRPSPRSRSCMCRVASKLAKRGMQLLLPATRQGESASMCCGTTRCCHAWASQGAIQFRSSYVSQSGQCITCTRSTSFTRARPGPGAALRCVRVLWPPACGAREVSTRANKAPNTVGRCLRRRWPPWRRRRLRRGGPRRRCGQRQW